MTGGVLVAALAAYALLASLLAYYLELRDRD